MTLSRREWPILNVVWRVSLACVALFDALPRAEANEEAQRHKQRADNAEKQSELLASQLEVATEQALQVQAAAAGGATGVGLAPLNDAEAQRSVDELRQLVAFMRQRNQVLSAQLDVALQRAE